MNTSQEVSGAIGVACWPPSPSQSRTTGRRRDRPVNALSDGLSRAFLIGAFIAIVGVVMALLLRRRRIRDAIERDDALAAESVMTAERTSAA